MLQQPVKVQPHHPVLFPALAGVGFILAIFAWSSQLPVPSHTLYFIPPTLSLLAGLAIAYWLHRVHNRQLAAVLAVVLGLVIGVVVGLLALFLVGAFLGAADLLGDDVMAQNEGLVSLIVGPLECVAVSFIGVVRDRRQRPEQGEVPRAISQPNLRWNPDPVTSFMPHAVVARHRAFQRTLFIGLFVFAALTFITALSGSVIAAVSVLVIGSFFVPVVYVQYLDEIDAFGGIPAGILFRVGFLTALFGIPSAGFLEAINGAGAGAFIPALITGLTEEGVKILMVFLLVRGTRYRYELDGVILGAAAGMGFAAFEDAGYAIAALNQHGIPDFLSTLWLRQVLGPFGHGTWTASIAAVIFRHRAEGQKPRWGHVWIAYFVSSLLHALWDWNPLAGLGSFIWMVVIGGISIIRLRGLVIESIKEERALGGGQLATS